MSSPKTKISNICEKYSVGKPIYMVHNAHPNGKWRGSALFRKEEYYNTTSYNTKVAAEEELAQMMLDTDYIKALTMA